MAVLKDFPGLEVQVFVDGEPLKEYDYPETAETSNAFTKYIESETVTKYIESESGKRFEVTFGFGSDFFTDHDISVHIHVDGARVGRGFVKKDTIVSGLQETFKGAMSGRKAAKLAALRFCALNIVDETNTSASTVGHSIGQIKLRFYRAEDIRETRNARIKVSLPSSTDATSPKKACAKALSHQTRMDEPQAVDQHTWLCCKDIGYPFATFVFEYRSIESLKSLRVIPGTPISVPEPTPNSAKDEHQQ